jgi:hypothetical protein
MRRLRFHDPVQELLTKKGWCGRNRRTTLS